MTNDPKDRHVLAAVVRGGAELLVSENLQDFPELAVKRYDLEVVNQDEFLLNQLDLAPLVVLDSLRRQASATTASRGRWRTCWMCLAPEVATAAQFASACRALL